MRVLWASNYSTQSGYSTQARLFVPRIQQAGHDVTVLELGASGMPRMIGNVQVLPTVLDPLASDILPAHAQKLGSDVVFTLVDAWGMKPDTMQQVRWYPFVPVDHTPVPPAVQNSLKAAQAPIAISRFGAAELVKAGFSPYYLPHGVDPAVWRPSDMQTARQALNVNPDTFLVSFVGVNDSVPSRKGIFELLAAWSMFQPTRRDARLYLHTSEVGNLPVNNVGGVRIDEIVRVLQIDPASVMLTDQYEYKTGMPQSHLANIANASDVLVLPSKGEGFGLPLVEFQRCGCPVITTDFAAGAELCFSGWKIPFEPDWSWQSALNAKPSIGGIVECLEAAYAERGNPRRRLASIEGAREYDIDVVFQKCAVPLLTYIAEQILDGVNLAS